MPNFTLIREYLGVSGPKNAKKWQNFRLFRPAGANPLPDVDEIRRIYAGNRSTKAINIWCDSLSKLGIYMQKTRWGIFPQHFRSPLASKLLVGLKNNGCAKIVRTSSIFTQSLVEIRRCTAAWETKVGCFFVFCLFVCLFVCHALDLEQRFSHSNSDIVAICRSILMRISAFFRGRNALSNISVGESTNFENAFFLKIWCAIFEVFGPAVVTYLTYVNEIWQDERD